MTYKFMFKEPIYSLNDENAESWFVNSYLAVDDNDTSDYEEADAEFQKRYNVKLIFKTKKFENETRQYEYIAGVEFESEAEAVLFALRWS